MGSIMVKKKTKVYHLEINRDLYEYQAWVENTKKTDYVMTKLEAEAYDKYMEGKLCGDPTSIVHSAQNIN